MDRLSLNHKARCLVIVAGEVIEGRIENRAREIALRRNATEIIPADVHRATTEFLRDELSTLPHLIEKTMEDYEHRTKAA